MERNATIPFLNLEKRNHFRKHIRKLNLSGVITSNPFEILEGVKTFLKKIVYV